MKIDVIANMRDEIQILPYFLRHYEQFADRIFVFDDQSVDGTREMLQAHPLVRLLPHTWHGTDDVYYVQSVWPQYRTISRGQADWCICVDADEFLYAPNIREILLEYQKRCRRRIRCTGFTMWNETFPTTPGQIYEESTMGWWDKWQCKTILFDPAIEMKWTHGRHFCFHNKTDRTFHSPDIRILHFRCMGVEYTQERLLKNYRNMNLPFNPKKHHNLPNGGRGHLIDFIQERKDLLVNALEHPIP